MHQKRSPFLVLFRGDRCGSRAGAVVRELTISRKPPPMRLASVQMLMTEWLKLIARWEEVLSQERLFHRARRMAPDAAPDGALAATLPASHGKLLCRDPG